MSLRKRILREIDWLAPTVLAVGLAFAGFAILGASFAFLGGRLFQERTQRGKRSELRVVLTDAEGLRQVEHLQGIAREILAERGRAIVAANNGPPFTEPLDDEEEA